MDVFRLVFIHCAQYTVLPELMDIFGSDAVTKFMDIFGGMTIKVPDRSVLERVSRDVDIYVTLSTAEDDALAASVLSTKYELPEEYVRDVFSRIKKLCDGAGL